MIWSHMGIRKEWWWWGGSMTDGRPCSSPCTWLGVTMLKVAMLHAGSAGVFVLLHPHHCLPFMYPDGVHFDLHCVLAPASSFPTSYSLFARRRFPSLPLSHTSAVFNHIIMSCRGLSSFQVFHFCAQMIYLRYFYYPLWMSNVHLLWSCGEYSMRQSTVAPLTHTLSKHFRSFQINIKLFI